jgi:hypothetical protein
VPIPATSLLFNGRSVPAALASAAIGLRGVTARTRPVRRIALRIASTARFVTGVLLPHRPRSIPPRGGGWRRAMRDLADRRLARCEKNPTPQRKGDEMETDEMIEISRRSSATRRPPRPPASPRSARSTKSCRRPARRMNSSPTSKANAASVPLLPQPGGSRASPPSHAGCREAPPGRGLSCPGLRLRPTGGKG